MVLADLALQRADRRLARGAGGLDNGWAPALRAAMLVLDGQWAAGQAAFEAAFKQRKSEIGGNKRFLADSVAWFYPLALLAQADAQAPPAGAQVLRWPSPADASPNPYEPLGTLGACDRRSPRQGADRRGAFRHPADVRPVRGLDSLWAILLAAWLGSEMIMPSGTPRVPAKEWRDTIAFLREKLNACRCSRCCACSTAREAVLDGRDPPAASLSPAPANSGERSSPPCNRWAARQAGDAGGEATRLLWEVELGKQGRLLAIKPLEQKRGPRGWGRPKAISLARIAGNEQLPTWDTKVARALRAERGYSNRYHLDLAAAIVALVGHPCVVLAQCAGAVGRPDGSGAGTRTGPSGRPLRDAHRATAAAGQSRRA
jgi:hypothetical protein